MPWQKAKKAPAYWTAEPFCSGCYQIHLPANRRGGSSHIKYNDWHIDVRSDYGDGRIRAIENVAKTGRSGSEYFVENRTIIPDKAMMNIDHGGYGWDELDLLEEKMLYFIHLNFKLNTGNGMEGSERLVKWQGNRYAFLWENQDGSMQFRMGFGANDKNSSDSPLTQ